MPQLLDPTIEKTIEPIFDLALNNLSGLVTYKSNSNALSNSIVSKVALPAGSHFCFITSHMPVPQATWSSIQTGMSSHVEFNNALVYANHSCEPTLELFVFQPDAQGQYISAKSVSERSPAVTGGTFGVAGEFRVATSRNLEIGDDLTWFYPSTEFCSPRPFECVCGARDGVCIGVQRGAKFLSKAQTDRYYLNPHIRSLIASHS